MFLFSNFTVLSLLYKGTLIDLLNEFGYFFDIFPVIPLTPGQTKHPFLKDGIFTIPKGDRKTQPLLVKRLQ